MSQEASNTPGLAVPDQIEYWNTEGGKSWTARQQSWDTAMKPFSWVTKYSRSRVMYDTGS